MEFKALYIKGWGVARMNYTGLTISKMVKRFKTKREAEAEAKRLNNIHNPPSDECSECGSVFSP